MPHNIKGQTPRQYRPSATRRVSGLSPINEKSNAQKRWYKLRQAVKPASQTMRNLRTQAAAANARNRKLLALVHKLNKDKENVNKFHKAQTKRLYEDAVKLNALRDPNYINAKNAALKIYKKNMAKLHGARNMVVQELVRNATSSQIRRNLYAAGMERGRHGTSQNNWQNWTNKLWHLTERKNQVNQFFKPASRA